MDFYLIPFGFEESGLKVVEWILDPEYTDFFHSVGIVPTIQNCMEYPKWTGNTVMMINSSETGKIVGMVSSYRPSYKNGTIEAGILIDKNHRGKGISRVALMKWIEVLSGLGFRKIVFNVVNPLLREFLEKQGCVLEGVHEAEVLINNQFVDEYRLAFTVRR